LERCQRYEREGSAEWIEFTSAGCRVARRVLTFSGIGEKLYGYDTGIGWIYRYRFWRWRYFVAFKLFVFMLHHAMSCFQAIKGN